MNECSECPPYVTVRCAHFQGGVVQMWKTRPGKFWVWSITPARPWFYEFTGTDEAEALAAFHEAEQQLLRGEA